MDELSLSSLIGRVVRIDRGGHESKVGRLLAVKPDHLVFQSEEEGILYYKTSHIKSVSLDVKNNSDPKTQPDYVQPEYLDFDNFTSVLEKMKYRWVKINRGGPESVEGMLSECNNEYCLFVIKEELVTVFNYHIRSISHVTKKQDNPNAQGNTQENKHGNNSSKNAKKKEEKK